MLTVHGQQHSFSTHERVFLGKCQSLWDRKYLDLRGTRTPPTFPFMPNALTYWAIRARHLLSHVVEYWLWRYRYFFKVKSTFEMLTVRGQQHSFLTHERVFLGKCQSFSDRKCLDLRGTRTPNLRFHAECSDLLSYQDQTFAVPCFNFRIYVLSQTKEVNQILKTNRSRRSKIDQQGEYSYIIQFVSSWKTTWYNQLVL